MGFSRRNSQGAPAYDAWGTPGLGDAWLGGRLAWGTPGLPPPADSGWPYSPSRTLRHTLFLGSSWAYRPYCLPAPITLVGPTCDPAATRPSKIHPRYQRFKGRIDQSSYAISFDAYCLRQRPRFWERNIENWKENKYLGEPKQERTLFLDA
jgi:hypothetical protein